MALLLIVATVGPSAAGAGTKRWTDGELVSGYAELKASRGSDLQGHELRFGWAFDARLNLLARLYLDESITTQEDGDRDRLDLNWRL